MEKLYDFLYYEIEEAPKTFGLFHIFSLILLIGAAFTIINLYKGDSDRSFRRIILAVWSVLLIGEIYREICYSLEFEDGRAVWDYAWYQFPFQLCSSPLYALPFLIFMPEGKVRDGFAAFVATFSFFGGVAVMIYPGNVMTSVIGISIQSMIHHGAQVLVTLLIAKRFREKYDLSFFKKGVYVFLCFLAVAMTLNFTVYFIFTANGITDDFNMFYISPFYDGILPILSNIQEMTTGWIIAPLYVMLFIPAAYLIFRAEKLLLEYKEKRGAKYTEADAK